MHMIDELKECCRYKDLLRQLVARDLKVRYKNSVLGFFWSLANPLVQVATITIVVKYILRLEIPNYSAYLLVGFLPWVFFQMALLDSSQVVLLHRDLLRKVYFPREVLPLSVVFANLIHFLLALVVFFAYLLFYIHFFLGGTWILPTIAWLPALIALQTLLTGDIIVVAGQQRLQRDGTPVQVVQSGGGERGGRAPAPSPAASAAR